MNLNFLNELQKTGLRQEEVEKSRVGDTKIHVLMLD
jgi:hypothetical protein